MSWTPRHLFEHAAQEFLKKNDSFLLFGYHSMDYFIPEYSEKFYTVIQSTLLNTQSFLTFLQSKAWLVNNGTFLSYIQIVVDLVHSIEGHITLVDGLLGTPRATMDLIKTELVNFKERLMQDYAVSVALPSNSPEATAAVPSVSAAGSSYSRRRSGLNFFHLPHNMIGNTTKGLGLFR